MLRFYTGQGEGAGFCIMEKEKAVYPKDYYECVELKIKLMTSSQKRNKHCVDVTAVRESYWQF